MVGSGYLLDTAVLIWVVEAPENLSPVARDICEKGDLSLFISVVSLMELIVKSQKRHLHLSPDPLRWWDASIKLYGFSVLPLRQNHVERLWTLPPIHKDPADRLLISQAIAEGIPLVTSDDKIPLYAVETIW